MITLYVHKRKQAPQLPLFFSHVTDSWVSHDPQRRWRTVQQVQYVGWELEFFHSAVLLKDNMCIYSLRVCAWVCVCEVPQRQHHKRPSAYQLTRSPMCLLAVRVLIYFTVHSLLSLIYTNKSPLTRDCLHTLPFGHGTLTNP